MKILHQTYNSIIKTDGVRAYKSPRIGAVREISICQMLIAAQCPGIVPMTIEGTRGIEIVMPLFDGTLADLMLTDLASIDLSKIREAKSDPSRIREAVRDQIGPAIAGMHRLGLLHRDIKPSNILFRRMSTPADQAGNFIFCLSDFGSAVFDWNAVANVKNVDVYSHEATTMAYRAPATRRNPGFYSRETDSWSFGKILHELGWQSNPYYTGTQVVACGVPVSPPRSMSIAETSGLRFAEAEKVISRIVDVRRSWIRDYVNHVVTALTATQLASQEHALATQSIPKLALGFMAVRCALELYTHLDVTDFDFMLEQDFGVKKDDQLIREILLRVPFS